MTGAVVFVIVIAALTLSGGIAGYAIGRSRRQVGDAVIPDREAVRFRHWQDVLPLDVGPSLDNRGAWFHPIWSARRGQWYGANYGGRWHWPGRYGPNACRASAA